MIIRCGLKHTKFYFESSLYFGPMVNLRPIIIKLFSVVLQYKNYPDFTATLLFVTVVDIFRVSGIRPEPTENMDR